MTHKLDSEKKLWEKAAAFHGHVCPGLTIGYRAALYAIDLLGLTFSDDEQVVCITENDACGVDAIQAILGCSIGKGNLLFHMRGKQAFSFYNRKTGKSVRLVLKAKPRDMTREETFDYYHSCADDEMFDVKEAKIRLPSRPEFLIPMSVIAAVRRPAQTGFGCPVTKSCAWTAMRRMTDLTSERFSVDHKYDPLQLRQAIKQ